MEYHGKLYGKIGGKYFDTGRTSDEFDKYQKQAIELQLIKESPFCPHCHKYKKMQGNGIMHQLCECGQTAP